MSISQACLVGIGYSNIRKQNSTMGLLQKATEGQGQCVTHNHGAAACTRATYTSATTEALANAFKQKARYTKACVLDITACPIATSTRVQPRSTGTAAATR